MRQHKKFFLLIVSYMLSLVILLVMFCCFILWAEKNAFDTFFYNKSSLHGYFKVSDWYQHKINSIIFKRTEMTYNLYFHPERLPAKKKGVFRVVIIGDSRTLGLGLRENEAPAKELKKQLDPNGKFEVIPVGLQGDSIIEDYFKQVLVKKYLDPNLIIIYMVNNDFTFSKPNQIKMFDDQYNDLGKKCNYLPEFDPYDNPQKYQNIKNDWEFESFSTRYSNSCKAEIVLSKFSKENTIFFTDTFTVLNKRPTNFCSIYSSIETVERYIEIVERAGFKVKVLQNDKKKGSMNWYESISQQEPHMNSLSVDHVMSSLKTCVLESSKL